MKKIIKSLALVLVTAMLLPGVAGACISHPCGCDADCYTVYPVHWEMNETSHILLEEQKTYCSNCNQLVGQGSTVPLTPGMGWEPHTFAGDTCTQCGYTKPAKKTPPSMQELQNEALNMGSDVIGKWVTIVRSGHIFREPDDDSQTMRNANENASYKVIDYQEKARDKAWFKIEFDSKEGWISAGIAQINKVDGETGSTEGLIGGVCKITYVSANARAGAGVEYHKIATVYQNETYEILDVAYASTGTIWYKIRRNNRECWVSSGISKVIEYAW